jgi:outer membrane protein assembly factor BamA
VIYDRDGTPRFFGLGNRSAQSAETNYTSEQEVVQLQAGYNISKIWQILYTARARQVDVLPGTLSGIPSIQALFPHQRGIGRFREALNRVSLVYNTMDDLTVPNHGMKLVEYTGIASRAGLFNDSLYTEAGFDGRGYFPVSHQTIIAVHLALRYLLSAKDVPFWALSSLGGDQGEIGGEQLLRGFGAGRYYDRNSLSMSAEVRRHIISFNAVSTHVDLEIAPFVDLGRVFGRLSTMPFGQLHHVYGVGFRGIARPFVVGYVDVGYGSNGVAVFTGISYPF